MINFNERDSVDSFEFFMENFEFRKSTYNFHILLGIFMKSLEQEIQEGYEKEEWQEVRNLIKKAIYKHFKDINFSTYYNKEEMVDDLWK